ncbi:MAG TPA: PepSY domain-containing protein [Steroidobacteraceae bacterium]|nr:PepSY domain-containing protein [Steroidobacteraceae bacterium]
MSVEKETMTQSKSTDARRSWPDYTAVWRWHFYAGLFCLPFVCWLSLTGSIYLFRPDIEAWLDRPYESLHLDGPRAAPSSEARAAIAAVPGSVFSRYEPPATPTGAAQIVVGRDGHLFRVYVQPDTLRALKVERDDHRVMELVSHLHGELLLGDRGSMLVELAASWAVVMILTGLYLWFPRGATRLGGVLYPRVGRSGRPFWRDLHAVTAMWVSIVTLFMLLSGLPWASNWGKYLTWVRNHWSVTAGQPDWPVGTEAPLTLGTKSAPHSSMPGMTAAEMAAMAPPVAKSAPQSSMPGMTAAEMAAMAPPDAQGGRSLVQAFQALDKVVPLAARLRLPRPVWILPLPQGGQDWMISSQVQDRPLRVTYTVNPGTSRVTKIEDFDGENIVDKVVNVAVAAHEGQLFGRLNQAILLLTAAGLVLVSISGTVMWWRRRPASMLGAPRRAAQSSFSAMLAVVIAALALLLPLFGLSLLLVLAIDRTLLPRLPSARRWLGLAPPSAAGRCSNR